MRAMILRLAASILLAGLASASLAEEPQKYPDPPPMTPLPPASESDGTPDAVEPPQGTPEDVALWKAGGDVSERVAVSRHRASTLQWRNRRVGIEQGIEALAKDGSAAGSKRAAEILAVLAPALAHNYLTLSRQWPVDPTRGCRYQVMHFESVIRVEASQRKMGQYLVTKDELEECVKKGSAAVAVLDASNADFERILDEAQAFLVSQGKLPATPARTPAPAAPAAKP
jgi:hypothetical protein